ACYGAHVDYAPGDLRYLADWFCIEEEQAMLVVPADGPVALLTDSAACVVPAHAPWSRLTAAAADLDRSREQAVCDEVEHAPELGTAVAARLRGFELVGITGGGGPPAAAAGAAPGGARGG